MFGNLLTSGASELLDKVGGVVDDLVTTKEEKLQIKKEFKQMMYTAQNEASAQVTSRWEYDMKSDNWLSKNIRPVVMIFLTVMFVVMSLFDGNVGEFEIADAYYTIYETLLLLVYGAYFAGRSFEKVTTMKLPNSDRELTVLQTISFTDDSVDEEIDEAAVKPRQRRKVARQENSTKAKSGPRPPKLTN